MDGNEFSVIYTFTREDAIESGALVDLTKEAEQAGFKIPVAMSAGLYHEYVKPSEELEAAGQSFEGRLHDVLMMLRYAAKDRWDGTRVEFEVLFQVEKTPSFKKVLCIAAVEGDSNGNPCLTIFRPEDD